MTVELHKGYVPGAIGRVAELHATYYQRIPGFGVFFESRVARELGQFCEAYDDDRDALWLAHLDGVIEGAIAIDGTHAGQDGAHLRWFITSDKVRGTGIGTRLLASAVEFCRARQYEVVFLNTFDGLVAARHLYEKFGFRLVHQQSGNQWGAEVVEQHFELRA
ncbi:MAG: GNAT family N-acetyltransferase [Burkholderiales bacterium]